MKAFRPPTAVLVTMCAGYRAESGWLDRQGFSGLRTRDPLAYPNEQCQIAC